MDILLGDDDALSGIREDFRAVDWAATPLGPVSSWDATLRAPVDLMLRTRFPVVLMWGPELVLVYNQAYVELIVDKHPDALGRPARQVFPEAWVVIGPMLHRVLDGEGANYVEDEYVPLHRRGFLEECYFTFSYSPVRGPGGEILGVMDIATETTQQVIARRRLDVLRRVTGQLAVVDDVEDVAPVALPVLRADTADFPEVDVVPAGGSGGHRPPVPSSREVVEVVEVVEGEKVAWLAISGRGPRTESWLRVRLSPHLAADDDYLGFLRLVAATLSQVLDRVRAGTAERHAAEVERGMSEAFQRSLLPQPPRTGRPEVAVRYQPAVELAQVGGDWYDFFDLPDGSLAVVIGDVAGHDQRAAAAMAQLRNMTRGVAFTMPGHPPAEIFGGLERALAGTAQDIVATGILAKVAGDENGLTLTWANAGHPPPVLVDADGAARLLEAPPDLMLGIDASRVRTDHRMVIEPGATLVMFTDGLVERRGRPIDEGLAWLLSVLEGSHLFSVEQVCDHLLSRVDIVEDDVALLVLRG